MDLLALKEYQFDAIRVRPLALHDNYGQPFVDCLYELVLVDVGEQRFVIQPDRNDPFNELLYRVLHRADEGRRWEVALLPASI